ncbi:hypothetical protein OHC33_004113 [Knufia fluminis]|uniref:Uncharacterized protein n=1 Tax=Knufia fluminis TaxID=191047 RepID=A0AAN8EV15_9EURO|nr:hypothetical protein OHC33_004113 [Knufia fluminis]
MSKAKLASARTAHYEASGGDSIGTSKPSRNQESAGVDSLSQATASGDVPCAIALSPDDAEHTLSPDSEILHIDGLSSPSAAYCDMDDLLASSSGNAVLSWSPSLLEPWKIYLLDHFSRKIAPEVTVIDDRYNGWRQLILPVAHSDDLVMDAVLSASAFHFAVNARNNFCNPMKCYTQAIRTLQQRQDLTTFDQDGRHSIFFALLVLLVTVMINGYSDFPLILKLLESALVAIGGEDQLSIDEIGQFLKRQIRKIYTTRATSGPGAPASTALVENFKQTLQHFPPDSPCEHVLVWPTFLAACESVTAEHRHFFTQALMRHHKRNGFGNIPRALSHLQRIWARGGQKSWTMLLPEPQVFIV